MKRFSILVLSFTIIIAQINAQENIFSGIIPSEVAHSLLEKVAVSDEHYYFAAWNFEDDEITASIFQTTYDFDLLNSVQNLKIRNSEASYLTYLEVVDDKLMMISSVNIDSVNRLYSHSLNLNLSKHTILDSLDLGEGEEFIAEKFKLLNNGNGYAIGNVSKNNRRDKLSANYIEFTKEGKFIRFENVDIPSVFLSAFDYSPNRNQYIVRDFANSYLLDSTFSVIYHSPANIPVVTSGMLPLQDIAGYCSFANDSLIQCIGRNSRAEEFTTFVAEFGISEDSLFYSNAISLHPPDLENERTTVVHVSRDKNGNHYLSYQGPFAAPLGAMIPNTVFISKFDKNFNELFFVELIGRDEYVISENTLDAENNLIIVGAVTTADNSNGVQNLYIKVSENGEILTNTLRPKVSTDIQLFPNPCIDYIKVESVDIFAQSDYHIYSLDGRLLSSGTLNSNEISTAALSTGMYILNILSENGIYASKFVKRNSE